MANEVKIRKTVFNKEQFKKVVDNKFTTFTQPVDEIDDITISEFLKTIENCTMKYPYKVIIPIQR